MTRQVDRHQKTGWARTADFFNTLAHVYEFPILVCLLDVREINLVNMDLFMGEWRPATKEERKAVDKSGGLDCLRLGSYCVERRSLSLLQEKCELMLQVERNLSDNIYKSGKYSLVF